jgi:predicted SpoU family rRNA methylase
VNLESHLGVDVDFVESDEHRDLRAAVGAVAAPFGGAYYVEHAREGRECTELWHALGVAAGAVLFAANLGLVRGG